MIEWNGSILNQSTDTPYFKPNQDNKKQDPRDQSSIAISIQLDSIRQSKNQSSKGKSSKSSNQKSKKILSNYQSIPQQKNQYKNSQLIQRKQPLFINQSMAQQLKMGQSQFQFHSTRRKNDNGIEQSEIMQSGQLNKTQNLGKVDIEHFIGIQDQKQKNKSFLKKKQGSNAWLSPTRLEKKKNSLVNDQEDDKKSSKSSKSNRSNKSENSLTIQIPPKSIKNRNENKLKSNQKPPKPNSHQRNSQISNSIPNQIKNYLNNDVSIISSEWYEQQDQNQKQKMIDNIVQGIFNSNKESKKQTLNIPQIKQRQIQQSFRDQQRKSSVSKSDSIDFKFVKPDQQIHQETKNRQSKFKINNQSKIQGLEISEQNNDDNYQQSYDNQAANKKIEQQMKKNEQLLMKVYKLQGVVETLIKNKQKQQQLMNQINNYCQANRVIQKKKSLSIIHQQNQLIKLHKPIQMNQHQQQIYKKKAEQKKNDKTQTNFNHQNNFKSNIFNITVGQILNNNLPNKRLHQQLSKLRLRVDALQLENQVLQTTRHQNNLLTSRTHHSISPSQRKQYCGKIIKKSQVLPSVSEFQDLNSEFLLNDINSQKESPKNQNFRFLDIKQLQQKSHQQSSNQLDRLQANIGQIVTKKFRRSKPKKNQINSAKNSINIKKQKNIGTVINIKKLKQSSPYTISQSRQSTIKSSRPTTPAQQKLRKFSQTSRKQPNIQNEKSKKFANLNQEKGNNFRVSNKKNLKKGTVNKYLFQKQEQKIKNFKVQQKQQSFPQFQSVQTEQKLSKALNNNYQQEFKRQNFEINDIKIPNIPRTPSLLDSRQDLLLLAKQALQQFGISINNQEYDKSLLKMVKYKNCVHFSLNSDQNILWNFDNGKFYFGGWIVHQHNENQGGQKQGQGFQFLPGKYIYKGQFIKGKRNGLGTLKYLGTPYSYIYHGQWLNGNKSGHGKQKQQNGIIYVGQWRDNKKQGYGRLIISDKQIYEGLFSKGFKEGHGKQIFKNGDKFQGSYQKGKFNGEGKYHWKNGSSYQGMFSNGMRNGKGTWKSSQIDSLTQYDIYEGQYLNDKKHGKGIYQWSNGTIYSGQFKNDMKDGQGTVKYQNGKAIKFMWEKGQPVKKIKDQAKNDQQPQQKQINSKGLKFEKFRYLQSQQITSNDRFKIENKPIGKKDLTDKFNNLDSVSTQKKHNIQIFSPDQYAKYKAPHISLVNQKYQNIHINTLQNEKDSKTHKKPIEPNDPPYRPVKSYLYENIQ